MFLLFRIRYDGSYGYVAVFRYVDYSGGELYDVFVCAGLYRFGARNDGFFVNGLSIYRGRDVDWFRSDERLCSDVFRGGPSVPTSNGGLVGADY